MNRILFSALCLFSVWCTAQSYIGYDTDNYSGIHGVLANPASMADSRLRADINLFSVSAFGAQNYAEIDYRKAIESSYKDVRFTDEGEQEVKYIGLDRKSSGLVNLDVLGPSFMFSINEKESAAFHSRVRGFGNLNEIDGRYQALFDEGLDNQTDSVLFVDENSFGTAVSILEFGVSYARVLKDDKQNFLKGGITFKYVKPMYYLGGGFTDAILNFDPDDAANNDVFGELNLQGSNLTDPEDDGYRNGGFADPRWTSKTSGFGFDIGFVYEYRPKFRKNISKDNVIKQVKFRHINTYKFRVGVSLLDIGRMKFESATSETYNLSNLPSELNEGEFDLRTNEEIKMSLPSTLRIDGDWAVSKKFYVNALTRLSLISKEKRYAVRYANQFTINPRLETRWLSVFSPFSITQFSGVQWGLGTRVGPLVLGSGNLLGSLVDRKTRAFDVYLGLKIPILHKIPKSKEAKEAIKRFECPDGCPEEKDPEVKRLEGKIKSKVERKLKRLDGYDGGVPDKVRSKKKHAKRLQGYRGQVK